MNASYRAALSSILLAGALLAGTGCVFRPNIQQGNLLKVQDVDQVTPGMTRSQVRYLLGTPMVADPFNPERWDYIYTFRRGRERQVDRSHFIVHFENDKVSRVEKPDMPEPLPTDAQGDVEKARKMAKEAERDPPAAPSIKQPQPDTPRPGGSN
jgi:outer membrane protein assembly factor BamE